MSKTMRKKKMKRYVQNLPYMHHDENSFRKSQISVTLSLAFQDKSKNFYYSTAIATLLLLYYLNYNYIILLLQYYELLKKVFFNHFVTVFLPPYKNICGNLILWQWETVSKHPTCNIIHTNFTIKKINLKKNYYYQYVYNNFSLSSSSECLSIEWNYVKSLNNFKWYRRFSIFYFPCPPSQPPVLVC